ncbi:hypothetical protein [Spirillospora sp. NPDC029432]|uniref:hypothetical protein n=1 Tax=Spirillospora sp. NPDC029432 TaxID=3154599 RepID=UPI00345181EF
MASEVTMTADPFGREYRADIGTFAIASVMGFYFLVVAVILLRGEDDSAVKILVPALLAGIIVLFLGARLWTRTCVSRDRILTRGLFRTIATPWQGIQRIEVVDGIRNRHVVIYDYRGREIVLPHLHSSEVDVEKEARALREIWEKRRGPHWKPISR